LSDAEGKLLVLSETIEEEKRLNSLRDQHLCSLRALMDTEKEQMAIIMREAEGLRAQEISLTSELARATHLMEEERERSSSAERRTAKALRLLDDEERRRAALEESIEGLNASLEEEKRRAAYLTGTLEGLNESLDRERAKAEEFGQALTSLQIERGRLTAALEDERVRLALLGDEQNKATECYQGRLEVGEFGAVAYSDRHLPKTAAAAEGSAVGGTAPLSFSSSAAEPPGHAALLTREEKQSVTTASASTATNNEFESVRRERDEVVKDKKQLMELVAALEYQVLITAHSSLIDIHRIICFFRAG
jgi:hypothetical protein